MSCEIQQPSNANSVHQLPRTIPPEHALLGTPSPPDYEEPLRLADGLSDSPEQYTWDDDWLSLVSPEATLEDEPDPINDDEIIIIAELPPNTPLVLMLRSTQCIMRRSSQNEPITRSRL